MKKTLIAVVVSIAIALSAGFAVAQTLAVPWYNETSGWDTWIVMSGDTDDAATTATITFYSSTGSALASTTVGVTNDGQPWVHKVGDFVTEDNSTDFGSFKIEEGTDGADFDSLNIVIAVQKTDTGVGFLIPVYGTLGAGTDLGKYEVGSDSAD